MRELDVKVIETKIKELAIEANYYLPRDVKDRIEVLKSEESYPLAKDILEKIEENYKVAEIENKPLCQDTGMACVFIEVGQDVHLVGGSLEESINNGVRDAYEQGYLRKSVVSDPIKRINSNNNLPAIINYKIVKGKKVKIIFSPKGFGSENMSQIKMLKPSDGVQGVKDFVLKVINDAGPNACPPMVIGVGIGGSFDKVTQLSKKAMMREIGSHHQDERYANLEKELLTMINATGIGPAGYGGKTTALSLNIETHPTHIAGMPVAVSICCHVSRHKEANL